MYAQVPRTYTTTPPKTRGMSGRDANLSMMEDRGAQVKDEGKLKTEDETEGCIIFAKLH